MKHTQGKWEVEYKYIIKSESKPIKKGLISLTICRTDNPHVSPSEAEANAQLIASAPELLEVCKKAKKEFEYLNYKQTVYHKLKQAIEKAEK